MMKPIILAMPGNEHLAAALVDQLHYEYGNIIFHTFPDNETYLKINTPLLSRKVIIIANFANPNEKILPLIFLIEAAKELGAEHIELLAPYLAYMRQDKRFQPGEVVTSKYFAKLLSGYINRLVTVDPHLHRYHSLREIYTIPTTVIHATDAIAKWINQEIKNPVLIGPDSESEQWVAAIATTISAPYIVLEKTRHSDHKVDVSIPQLENYPTHTPVLVDDIIATAQTMIEAVRKIKQLTSIAPICIGVHAIFAGNAYDELLEAGASKVITCNTVSHISNAIDLSADLSACF